MDTQPVRLQAVEELLRVRLRVTVFVLSWIEEIGGVVRGRWSRELMEDLPVHAVHVAVTARKLFLTSFFSIHVTFRNEHLKLYFAKMITFQQIDPFHIVE